ncbi:PcfJ domain-containing protein [Alteromonas sp. ASW11-36]|uniref:PcfJ domain-containing protein n=1 Tax=Alteromonas arenosi TaxID=3055817 RepID=A0ABT7SWH4_9ALTE|nr:PcfJ domain-containing protein [Alteromonas sp. ASW11-36]MDM7860529.1 PcfJ domain-containing protein [Alteromonas sp. ASW11-36]
MKHSERVRLREQAERLDFERKTLRISSRVVRQCQEDVIAQNLARKPKVFRHSNTLVCKVADKAPKLVKDQHSLNAVEHMARIATYRDVDSWQPQGKGYRTLLVSLAEHLFAAYPMPEFIWSVFWATADRQMMKQVARIAYGTSVFALCESGSLPVPLTRRQCHALMQLPASLNFIEAIRYVQVMSCGGSYALFQAWSKLRPIMVIQEPAMEQFWQQVLLWCCKQTELSVQVLPQLVEYLRVRKGADRQFVLHKQSYKNVLYAMYEWQRHEAMRKKASGQNLPESGWLPLDWKESMSTKRGRIVTQQWQVDEILSIERLLAEGIAMNHCVYGYRNAIKRGNCSIWSLRHNQQRVITIEVNNASRRVVQVKGKYNREPSNAERQAVVHWAVSNNLRLN